MPLWIRAFSDAPIRFGAIDIAYSLAEGDYDMSRLSMPGIPFLFAHGNEKLGNVTGYEVKRPDPMGEGTAAMYLWADLLDDSLLTEEGRAHKARIIAGDLTGTSAGWDTTRARYVKIPTPVGWPENLFGSVCAKGWALVEDSATDKPLVKSARIIRMTASASSGVLTEAEARAIYEAAVGETAQEAPVMDEQQIKAQIEAAVAAALAAQPAPAGSPAVVTAQAPPVSPPASPPTPVSAPAVPPASPPGAVPPPAAPVAGAAPPAQDVAQLQAMVTQLQAQVTQAQASNEEFRNHINSLQIQPRTIEQAAREPGQHYNLGAALAMAGVREATTRVNESDYALTRVRMDDTHQKHLDKKLHLPSANGLPCLATTMADLWPQADVRSTDVVEQISRTMLTPEPNVQNFPYKDRLDIIRPTGELWVPVVKTMPTAHETPEGNTAPYSDYATEKEQLNPLAANVAIQVTAQAFFMEPATDAQIRAAARRVLDANDQHWIETDWNASTAPQGFYGLTNSDKVVVAAAADLGLDDFLEMDNHLGDAIQETGYDYFYVASGALFKAARAKTIDQGSGLYLAEGSMNRVTIAKTGRTMYRSSKFQGAAPEDMKAVLVPGMLYKYAEWQGVMVIVDPYTAKRDNKVEYSFNTFRDGVAIYTHSFPYIAKV